MAETYSEQIALLITIILFVRFFIKIIECLWITTVCTDLLLTALRNETSYQEITVV